MTYVESSYQELDCAVERKVAVESEPQAPSPANCSPSRQFQICGLSGCSGNEKARWRSGRELVRGLRLLRQLRSGIAGCRSCGRSRTLGKPAYPMTPQNRIKTHDLPLKFAPPVFDRVLPLVSAPHSRPSFCPSISGPLEHVHLAGYSWVLFGCILWRPLLHGHSSGCLRERPQNIRLTANTNYVLHFVGREMGLGTDVTYPTYRSLGPEISDVGLAEDAQFESLVSRRRHFDPSAANTELAHDFLMG